MRSATRSSAPICGPTWPRSGVTSWTSGRHSVCRGPSMAKRPARKRWKQPVVSGPLKLTEFYIDAMLRKSVEAGDAKALLDVIDLCVRTSTRVPPWAAQPYCDRYQRWIRFEAVSLDDAFGVQRPK